MTDQTTDRRVAEAGEPRPDSTGPSSKWLIEVDRLTVNFGPKVRAVEEVSLSIGEGEIFALVGESGCGKSTLAYSLLGLIPPPGKITSGEVRFRGRSYREMSKQDVMRLRAEDVAIVFQGAMNSFNPVITIGAQVDHVLEAHRGVFESKEAGRAYFKHLLDLVRLPAEKIGSMFESQLSGGMKQRVAIALALLLRPSLIVMDEPTTALDVLNQRLVIDILYDLHESLGLTIVFVTHDLGVVAELAERVAVLYAGRLVELGTVGEIFAATRRHPYVAALVDAIPSVLERGLDVRPIPGQVPNLAELPPGCRFAPRCQLVEPVCSQEEPPLVEDSTGHQVACFVANRELGGVRQ